ASQTSWSAAVAPASPARDRRGHRSPTHCSMRQRCELRGGHNAPTLLETNRRGRQVRISNAPCIAWRQGHPTFCRDPWLGLHGQVPSDGGNSTARPTMDTSQEYG